MKGRVVVNGGINVCSLCQIVWQTGKLGNIANIINTLNFTLAIYPISYLNQCMAT